MSETVDRDDEWITYTDQDGNVLGQSIPHSPAQTVTFPAPLDGINEACNALARERDMWKGRCVWERETLGALLELIDEHGGDKLIADAEKLVDNYEKGRE